LYHALALTATSSKYFAIPFLFLLCAQNAAAFCFDTSAYTRLAKISADWQAQYLASLSRHTINFEDEREDTMVEHHFDDEDEWLGPRASCIVHDVPLERTYDVGGKFCGVKFLVSQRQLCICIIVQKDA
jgi:hypothetical protein